MLALIVAMIGLMFWQIDRLHEKQAINAKVEQGARRPAGADSATPRRRSTADGAAAVEYRKVADTGTFDPSAEVTVANRTLRRRARSLGGHAVPPVRRRPGRAGRPGLDAAGRSTTTTRRSTQIAPPRAR